MPSSITYHLANANPLSTGSLALASTYIQGTLTLNNHFWGTCAHPSTSFSYSGKHLERVWSPKFWAPTFNSLYCRFSIFQARTVVPKLWSQLESRASPRSSARSLGKNPGGSIYNRQAMACVTSLSPRTHSILVFCKNPLCPVYLLYPHSFPNYSRSDTWQLLLSLLVLPTAQSSLDFLKLNMSKSKQSFLKTATFLDQENSLSSLLILSWSQGLGNS